jgi:outer membrane lipoprotein-sorting protein
MIKKIFPLFLVVASLVAGGTFIPASRANGQTAGLVSSILGRMEKNKRNLKSLRASISMTKYNSQLRDSDAYQGLVLYIPGAAGNSSSFVRLEWTRPQHEILAVANGSYTLYRPRLNQAYRGKTGAIKSQKDSDVLSLMNMSAAQLRTRFGDFQDVHDETLWGGVWTQHFKVTPKGGASYKYIEVWVDKDGMPVQTKMVEKNDDSTTVRLTNVERNASIPMDQFKIDLDSKVKIVKG